MLRDTGPHRCDERMFALNSGDPHHVLSISAFLIIDPAYLRRIEDAVLRARYFLGNLGPLLSAY